MSKTESSETQLQLLLHNYIFVVYILQCHRLGDYTLKHGMRPITQGM